MLILSPLRDPHHNNNKDENQGQMVDTFGGGGNMGDDFQDFSGGNLLDSIDFDDLFIGIHDGDVLPDLEMDSEMLAEFSASGGEECSVEKFDQEADNNNTSTKDEKGHSGISTSGLNYSSSSTTPGGDQEFLSKRDDDESVIALNNHNHNINNPSTIPNKEADDHSNNNKKARKSSSSSAHSKNSHGKRKVKVDWTPELHRRFVQAVEQLGVDKAVPSRILELMGIDCLTRHNIASHLQKYRSHRKHLLAREAEAASWTQRRQMFGSAAAASGGGVGVGKRPDMSPWLAPTMGFPPITPMHQHHHHFRPLHVWGHPTVDQSMMHKWPKHLGPHFPSPPAQPPAWRPAPPPPPDPSYWNPHHHRAPNVLTPGTPCFSRQLATTRFGAPVVPVPGIPPHAMYKVDPGIAVPTGQSGPHPLVDFHPSKESIDAAIGDVLSKPWLPLPLGLKPPSTDSVMVELQRQGIPKVPPSCA